MNDPFKEPVLYDGEVENDDINLSMPPASGEEYIKRVILEARQCEDVTFAKIDETRLKKPTLNVKSLPGCTTAPEFLRPTIEWQQCQLADFSNLRLYMVQVRCELSAHKKKLIVEQLPKIDDATSWINMCKDLNESKFLYNVPTLTVILSLNQPTIEQVLKYLIEYLEEQTDFVPQLGQWLYSLLAALEFPLNPDMCSCLRSLARKCSEIRSKMTSSNVNEAVPLNLFICLVARYFRQLDLADP